MIKLIAFFLFFSSFYVIADDSSDGCGLGWQVTKNKTFSATTTRMTTNAFVPPTFGMTSGTIGCEQHGLAKKEAEQLYYANANIQNLSVELALGQGEYVDGLAQVLGCDVSAFSASMQANYPHISTVNGQSLLDSVKHVVKQNLNCNLI
ncbi:MAG: hypothetical protein A2381_04190 [Bdellovibrionales bacterium RIFOXYB1_FULL_37_110]|nr:MAG: hypothetical protein A2417_03455 [Bdellovibrionales bacterium RIFOXYC1_FULL_37_79]OFZ53457.1 MAG: hypothetical protein A2328_05150 [Bdellovibrionales bacterium RIFOXYB2_FULL_36_6]OFZ57391.1 MAG: hypothetical protein A2381_04190 [Bdellovibrionales bacterium RIFOXYB1_FULL_37_110]OFZ64952.1 MAG: hypothetical protein A2577_02675 [Bdellovibrionales bacterium RIFOXYD1_FULL_36_51]